MCGDGRVISPEMCDDGPLNHSLPFKVTGCLLNCSNKSPEWNCIRGNFDIPSNCTPICGDSKRVGNEKCDDGNLSNETMCNSLCSEFIDGWTC